MSEESNKPTERARALIEDSSKALRAPKDTSAAGGELDKARTAARYVGDEHGVPQFQIVSTRVRNFPKGSDFVGVHSLDQVADWISKQDPDEILVRDEDGFEPTDYRTDRYEEVFADA